MLTDILEIDQGELADTYNFTIKSGGNIIIFGAAGIGKTFMAMQAIEASGIKQTYLNLSVLESCDMIGLPKLNDDTTTYAPPHFWPLTENDDEPTVIILDEIDKTKQELDGPLLELFQFKSINGRKLNIKAIIATGNLPSEQAFSRKLSHALTNRCSLYKVKHEFAPWRRWAIKTGINSLVVSFLQSNQQYLLKPNDSGDPTAYASPSPRSWSLAAQDLDQVSFKEFDSTFVLDDDIEMDRDEASVNAFVNFQFRIIAGRVGIGAALKFKHWLKFYRELDPYIDVLLQTGEIPSESFTTDKLMVCAISAISRMRVAILDARIKPQRRKELANNVFGWMHNSLPPDYNLAAIKSTLNKDHVANLGLLDCEPFNAMIDEIHELAR